MISDRYSAPDNTYGYGLPQYGDIVTSLETELVAVPLLAYPNPHTGNSFRITNLSAQSITEINIFDLTGSKVGLFQWYYVNDDQNEIELVTETMSSGSYIVQIRSATDSEQIKILKH